MPPLGTFKVLVSLSLRSLLSHRTTTLVIGSIIFFGTMLVVLGTALLDSVDRSMQKSIVNSLAGHLQVYSSDARDELALFGSGFMGAEEIGRIPDFSVVKNALEKLDNVRAVVPMGLQVASVVSGNEIDRVLERLRAAARQGDTETITVLEAQMRNIAADLEQQLTRTLIITADANEVQEGLRDVTEVQSDGFWARLVQDPEPGMQLLETRIAPLAEEGQLLYLRNLGTNLPQFSRLFDRMELVEGEMVPPGKRGFLFSKHVYERRIKHKVARELDRIQRALVEKNQTIARDPRLLNLSRQLPGQYRRIAFQLKPADAVKLTTALKKLLPDSEGDLNALIQAFLRVDDDNFAARYAFFYKTIAPMIDLYPVRIGDTLTLRSMTRSGYLKSVNVKVYGTFQFKSLERSALAGAQNLVDLATFREIYGVMTKAQQRELQDIRAEVGIADIGREGAEADLFGSPLPDSSDQIRHAQAADEAALSFDEFEQVDVAAVRAAQRDASAQTFNQDTINRGLALNAAVLLHDPNRIQQTQAAIRALSEEQSLGVQVTDWKSASGIVGQLITVIRIVLYVAISIIFLVAVVIINNSMVIATMDRVAEIGTMRAVGAQRAFIMTMFFFETFTLTILAGICGAAAGAGIVAFMGSHGLPATSDILVFLFSGPRLYPTVGLMNLTTGLVLIMLVSLASTLYPAHIATRIQPVVAMQGKE